MDFLWSRRAIFVPIKEEGSGPLFGDKHVQDSFLSKVCRIRRFPKFGNATYRP